jgi:AmmeMemoRadiSam system protein A
MMTQLDRDRLLQIARAAITAHLAGVRADLPVLEGAIARTGGAFVSLHKERELRGCIGHLEADLPLGQVVAQCAVSAATADPRFQAVEAAEMSALTLEISVLGPLEPVTALDEVEPGRHGLVVEMGWRRGLLLPQVATEWNWDREAFAAHTCRKAGLPPDAWKKGARLWRFEAEVFAE